MDDGGDADDHDGGGDFDSPSQISILFIPPSFHSGSSESAVITGAFK